MFEVALPGIITGDRLAEVREGFTIAGIRYETFDWDSGDGFDDGTTVFLFDAETEAAKFKMMRG